LYEEEIDLRPYIQALIEKWYWVVGTAVVAAVIAFVASSLTPPTYEAETAVAIVRTRTDITFDPRIVTEDEAFARDQNARRTALVALVTSTDVIEAVLADMGDQIEPNQRRVNALRNMVTAVSDGDLIRIRVRHGQSATAADLANSWGRQYERHINQLYGSGRGEGLETITAQVQTARTRYETAQSDLETFTRTSRIAALSTEIEAQERVLTHYYDLLTSLQTSPVQLSQRVLAQHYTDLQRIESWLMAAQSLRQQVATGGSSSGAAQSNQVSYLSLHSQIYSSMPFSTTLPVEIQVAVGEVAETAVIPADLDNLLTILTERREATLAQIDAWQTDVETMPLVAVADGDNVERPLQEAITTLSQQIAALQAELVAQEAQQTDLLQARELAWNTYQSLALKQAETEIAAQTLGSEVRLASRAAVPELPTGPGKLVNSVIAAVLGFLASFFVITTTTWWKKVEHSGTIPDT
jgi:uncharacterized protein involved in exopolysaccharide biosynthesis